MKQRDQQDIQYNIGQRTGNKAQERKAAFTGRLQHTDQHVIQNQGERAGKVHLQVPAGTGIDAFRRTHDAQDPGCTENPEQSQNDTENETQSDRSMHCLAGLFVIPGTDMPRNDDSGTGGESGDESNHEIHVGLREINKQVLKEDGTRDYSKVTGSGRLKFICGQGNEWHNWNLRCAAQDTQYTHLEEKIEQIIDVLENIADERDRAEEERKQAEERQKQEEERKRLEAEKQAQIEKRREIERDLVRELIINVDRSRTATMIREYITKYEAEMVGNMEEKELQKRLKWMREKADYIDPFINREDEWLTEEDLVRLMSPEIIKTKEKRQPSSYGYGQETELSYWQIKNAWWNKK